jgi:hypothetical protein
VIVDPQPATPPKGNTEPLAINCKKHRVGHRYAGVVFRGSSGVYFTGIRVDPGDKVGNLKRGGRLERVKPIPVSENPVEQPSQTAFGLGGW